MSPSSLPPLLLLLSLLALTVAVASDSTIKWPLSSSSSAMTMFLDSEANAKYSENILDLDVDDDEETRRSMLYWGRVTYYISYAALAANRIPCPARSGRSYYTHNCYKASGPVRPYYRGCPAITMCRK
ncbi:hypothetical protein Droror1_Dr00010722 [Drosera rotundifolia]